MRFFWGVLFVFASALSRAQVDLPVVNPGFEGEYVAVGGSNPLVTGKVSPGWGHNFGYGDSTVEYGASSENPHSGATSQRVSIGAVTSGQLQLIQPIHISSKGILQGRIWLRGTAGKRVNFNVSLGHAPWSSVADVTVQMTSDWKPIDISGYLPGEDDYNIILGANEPVTFWADDLSLKVVPGSVNPRPNLGPVPWSLMGLHVTGWSRGILRNGNIEAPFYPLTYSDVKGELAYRWDDASASGTVIQYSAGSSPHSGAQSQRVQVLSAASYGLSLQNNVYVVPGKAYTAKVWLKGKQGDKVYFALQNHEAPYDWYAASEVQLTQDWQQVSISGIVSDTGNIGLVFASSQPTDFEFDDASLTESGGGALTNRFPWPQVPFGTLRLWDSGTNWHDLEPKKGVFNWALLDDWVNRARTGGVSQVILTLGQSPSWASSDPTRFSYYGSGASAPPASLQDWKDYVRAVAERYRGRIRYFEIWNEPNDATFYSGSVQELVDLTREASLILKEVDPNNKVITPPAYSSGYLRLFLAADGAQYADIVGHHFYRTPPEDTALDFANVRLAMEATGAANMPLWDTEGAAGDQSTSTALVPEYLARKYLIHLFYGVENFGWYTWGPSTPFCLETATMSGGVGPAGKGFYTLHRWLVGASITSATIDQAGNYCLKITKGYNSYLIVWNPQGPSSVTLPIRSLVDYGLDGVPNIRVLRNAPSGTSPRMYQLALR